MIVIFSSMHIGSFVVISKVTIFLFSSVHSINDEEIINDCRQVVEDWGVKGSKYVMSV